MTRLEWLIAATALILIAATFFGLLFARESMTTKNIEDCMAAFGYTYEQCVIITR